MWVTKRGSQRVYGPVGDVRWQQTEHLKRHGFLDKAFADPATKYPNVTILTADICVETAAPCPNDLPLYWDDDHLMFARTLVSASVFANRSRASH